MRTFLMYDPQVKFSEYPLSYFYTLKFYSSVMFPFPQYLIMRRKRLCNAYYKNYLENQKIGYDNFEDVKCRCTTFFIK